MWLEPNQFDNDQEKALFRQGVELFNNCQWLAAHEAWEAIWLSATGQRKRYYQGLIQIAVLLEHARRGNDRGVRSLWISAQHKWENLGPLYSNLDMAAFLAAVGNAAQEVLQPSTETGPAAPNPHHLQSFRWDLVPRISRPENAPATR